MPARAALKTVPSPKPRLEEWCVEAETPEEASSLLAAGAGHRCAPGESIQIEFDSLLDD